MNVAQARTTKLIENIKIFMKMYWNARPVSSRDSNAVAKIINTELVPRIRIPVTE